MLGRHVSHDPVQGINDVGFAATVTAYNGGDGLIKTNDGFFTK